MPVDKATIEKLKKILRVSKSIEIERMREMLKMDKETFNDKLLDLADEFGFEIDREYVNINRDNIGEFIDMLDGQFESWEKKELTRTGKIEDIKIEKVVVEKRKEPEEKPIRAKEIITFRGAQVPKFEADVLQEIEKLTNKQFSKLKLIKYDTQMGFTAEYQRIIGIGLYKCGLLTLPESISNLKSLETLSLEDNKLTSLPESIGNLSSLKELWLDHNQLTTLPESIGNLSSLETLYLHNNELTTLPESITKLKSLQTLRLINNKLMTLPESISNLKSLETLGLGGNQFTTLPESIGNLSSLKTLYLRRNKLTTLPESISNLTLLQ